MNPVMTRLARRRAWLMGRFALMQAAGDLDEPGGEIAVAAVMDEMSFLRDLYEVLLLVQIREGLAEPVR